MMRTGHCVDGSGPDHLGELTHRAVFVFGAATLRKRRVGLDNRRTTTQTVVVDLRHLAVWLQREGEIAGFRVAVARDRPSSIDLLLQEAGWDGAPVSRCLRTVGEAAAQDTAVR